MNVVELGWQAFAVVLAIGALAGAFSLWIFRRFTNIERLRKAANRMLAYLFEFRLFADEPALLLRAQWNLLKANTLLLREILLPSLLLLLPFALLMSGLESLFAYAPLIIGQPAIVMVTLENPDSVAQLVLPEGINLETPPVRILRLRQVSWRIRPLRKTRADLRIITDHRAIEQQITAGAAWRTPTLQLHSPVSIRYPDAAIFHSNWIVWFTLGTFLGAAILAIGKYLAIVVRLAR